MLLMEEPAMRISLTLDEQTAQALQRRAASRNQSMPRYLAQLAEAEARREADALAEAGYLLLADDTQTFAEDALRVARQDWK